MSRPAGGAGARSGTLRSRRGRRGRPGGRPRVRAPAGARRTRRPDPLGGFGRRGAGRGPWRGPPRRDRRSRPRRLIAKAPSTATTPAASSEASRSTRARRAPSSTTTRPRDGRAKAIQQPPGRRVAAARAWHDGARPPAWRREGVGEDVRAARRRRSPSAPRTTRPSAPRPASTPSRRCPPGSTRARPAARSSSASIARHLLDERRASASRRGSAVKSPAVSVSRTSSVGPEEVGDEGGEAVVVPEADLVVGDRVVLVHDRDDAELEEAARGSARACRYWRRSPKSSGARSTWPARSPSRGEARRRRRASAGAGRSTRAPAG